MQRVRSPIFVAFALVALLAGALVAWSPGQRPGAASAQTAPPADSLAAIGGVPPGESPSTGGIPMGGPATGGVPGADVPAASGAPQAPATPFPGPSRPRRVEADLGIPLSIPPDTLAAKMAWALDRAGVDANRLAIDPATVSLWDPGAGRVPIYDVLMKNPAGAPDLFRVLGTGAVRACASASELVLFAGQRAGFGVRRGLTGSPHEGRWAATADAKALDRALAAVAARGGEPAAAGGGKSAKKSKSGGAKGAKGPSSGDVPADAKHLTAFLLDASLEALQFRDEALSALPNSKADRDSIFAELLRVYASEDTASDDRAGRAARALDRRVEAIDLPLLHAGAMDLAIAIDEARSRLDSLNMVGTYHFEAETPLGTVVIDGSGSTIYDAPGPYLLIVDAGGHDTYGGGAATLGDASPVSVLFEMAGDDRYAAVDTTRPSWGGACLGYAALVDLAGNDTYGGGVVSCGAAVAGCGMLLDLAGDDRYGAVTLGEGAAAFGVGVLGDRSGRDRYEAFQAAQGYGGPRGAGVLADSAGNDLYVAIDDVVRFPSAQDPAHNTSLAQGAASGRRADISDGHSRAGGFGLLADGGGDDTYRCGVFGQGVGYWFGVGLLVDAAGADSMSGVWYTQGAAAHFAVGALLDLEGDDVFRATRNMAQGAGHDFSLGMFLDYGGDDEHLAPNLSLGGGNANGLGIFFDAAGRDRYALASPDASIVFGRGTSVTPRGGVRDLFPTTGIFLDAAGKDAYPLHPLAGNGKRWRQEGTETPSLTTEYGYGFDGF